jgi:hypothetical protein
MPYSKNGYPSELANKVGHIRLINDPMIQGMIEAFEDARPTDTSSYPTITGNVDLAGQCQIDQVITIDGGNQVVPNTIRPERQVGFVQIAAQLIRMNTVEELRNNPMADPRDVRRTLNQFVHHTLVTIPMSGIRIPGLSVRQSIRQAIHRFIFYYQLYDALLYLVFRQWQKEMTDQPSMLCLECGKVIFLPRNAILFRCSACNAEHTLSDYLGLTDEDSDSRPRLEVVSNLRAVLEALVLFSFVIKLVEYPDILNRTLFLLDGPLTLRAQLSRLVEPIRDLIKHCSLQKKEIFIVGVEKSGEVRDFADVYSQTLQVNGDFFIPTIQYIIEEMYGRCFNASIYRNRVNYGSKAVARLGADHVIVLDIPTGEFLLCPDRKDLLGFEQICRCLSKLLSYRFDNALIPIVLANSEASISNQPSGGLLAQFVDGIINAHP